VPDVDTDTVTVGVTDTLGEVVDDPETVTVTDCDGLPVGEPLGEIVGVAVFEVVTVVDKDGLAEPVIDGVGLVVKEGVAEPDSEGVGLAEADGVGELHIVSDVVVQDVATVP
jgi:hypothetical protein